MIFKKNKKYNVFSITFSIFKCSKMNVSIITIYSLVSMLIPSIKVLSASLFIDTTVLIIQGESPISSVRLPVVMLFFILFFEYGGRSLINFVNVRLKLDLHRKLRLFFVELYSKLNFSNTENEKTLELITRVKKEPEEWAFKTLNSLLSLIVMIMRFQVIARLGRKEKPLGAALILPGVHNTGFP